MFIVIKPVRKNTTTRNNPITLNPFRIGSGHFSQTKSSTCSYLFSSSDIHDEQRYPSYPEAQFTAN